MTTVTILVSKMNHDCDVNADDIQTLEGLGFSTEQANNALVKTNNNGI